MDDSVDKTRLARALEALLTATPLTRDEWANVLGVRAVTIEMWLAGEDIPTASALLMIIDGVQLQSSYRSLEVVDALYALCDCKLQDLTPLPVRLRGTLGDYLMDPLVEAFRGVLRTVPVGDRREALVQACQVVRQLRDPGSEPPEVELPPGWRWQASNQCFVWDYAGGGGLSFGLEMIQTLLAFYRRTRPAAHSCTTSCQHGAVSPDQSTNVFTDATKASP